jgi:hypothetical protein
MRKKTGGVYAWWVRKNEKEREIQADRDREEPKVFCC